MVRIDEGAAEAAEAAGTMVDSLDGWRLFRRTAFQSGGHGFSVGRLFSRAAFQSGGFSVGQRLFSRAAAFQSGGADIGAVC
jgi:hypothetical protein